MQNSIYEIKCVKYLFNEVAEKKQTKRVSRIIKATLKHLNGQESEIKLVVPNYDWSGEISELGYYPVSNYVESLTTSFVQIESYSIMMGSIDSNGNEHYSCSYPEVIIPLGKVYSNGKWVDPYEEYEKNIKKQSAA